jgi:hypothetical protein
LIFWHICNYHFSVLSHDGVYTELGYFSLDLFKGIFSYCIVSVLFFAFFIPVSALIADRIGREKCLHATTAILFLVLPLLFS